MEWKVRRILINIHIYFGNDKLFQYDSTFFSPKYAVLKRLYEILNILLN